MSTKQQPITYENATGAIEFTLTDDTVFHYVLQKSENALKGLVCSLKGINPSIVKNIEVKNPIDFNDLGKETIMDLKLILNSGEIINIELQMYSDKYWKNRSILYLCRAYDSLTEGESYSKLKPTAHYCITNQDMFPEHPEFYAKFLLMNVKKHYPYTKNFSLNVLQLQYIDMATKEDISSNLVYWAKLFNATTWEEFKALAAGNADIEEVGNLILTLNTDDKQKELLEGQRRYREQMASQYTAGYTDAEEAYQNIIISKDATITDQANTISEQANTIADRDNTIKQLQAQIAQLKGEQ